MALGYILNSWRGPTTLSSSSLLEFSLSRSGGPSCSSLCSFCKRRVRLFCQWALGATQSRCRLLSRRKGLQFLKESRKLWKDPRLSNSGISFDDSGLRCKRRLFLRCRFSVRLYGPVAVAPSVTVGQ